MLDHASAEGVGVRAKRGEPQATLLGVLLLFGEHEPQVFPPAPVLGYPDLADGGRRDARDVVGVSTNHRRLV